MGGIGYKVTSHLGGSLTRSNIAKNAAAQVVERHPKWGIEIFDKSGRCILEIDRRSSTSEVSWLYRKIRNLGVGWFNDHRHED